MEDRTEPRASCTCSDDSINKWIGGAEGHPVWETLGGAAYEVPGLRAYHCLDCGGVAVVEDRRLPPNTMNCERCFQPLDAPSRPNYPCFSKHAPIPCSYCGTPLTREDFEGATVYDMATEQAAKLMRPCLACRRGERDSEPDLCKDCGEPITQEASASLAVMLEMPEESIVITGRRLCEKCQRGDR